MGIRIYKTIGYAITDLDSKNDYRVKPKFYDTSEWEEVIKNINYVEFIEWCQSNAKSLIKIAEKDLIRFEGFNEESDIINYNLFPASNNKTSKETKILDTIIYNSEFGSDKVVLFKTFCEVDSWSRYDDIIDYSESNKNTSTEIKKLDWAGIYPHDKGPVVRFRGEPVEEKYLENLHCKSQYLKGVMEYVQFCHISGKWNENGKFVASIEVVKDLNENWRCKLPFELVAQLVYLDLFTDVKTLLNDLVPISYTFWS